MAAPKKAAPKKRRRASVGKRAAPRRRRAKVSGINFTGIAAMIGGAVISRMEDPMIKKVVTNDTMRAAIKTGVGVFLSSRGGVVGNLGAGMAIESGAALVGSMMPGGNMAGFGSTNDPVLIGYTADEIGDEFGVDMPALISGDEFGEDEMEMSGDEFGEDEMGEDEMEMSGDEFGYDVDELQGIN